MEHVLFYLGLCLIGTALPCAWLAWHTAWEPYTPPKPKWLRDTSFWLTRVWFGALSLWIILGCIGIASLVVVC